MKLDRLFTVNDFVISYRAINANQDAVPSLRDAINETKIVLSPVNGATTYGGFLYLGYEDRTDLNTCATLNLTLFIPTNESKWNNLAIQASSARTNVSGDDVMAVFGVSTVTIVTFTFGYGLFNKVSLTNETYPHIVTGNMVFPSNSNFTLSDISITTGLDNHGRGFPLFVDVDITRDYDYGNDLRDVLTPLKNLGALDYIFWDTIKTGYRFVETIYHMFQEPWLTQYQPRNISLINKLKLKDYLVPFFPYLVPHVQYDVTLNLDTGLATINYDVTNIDDWLRVIKIKLVIYNEFDSKQKTISLITTDILQGTVNIPITSLMGMSGKEFYSVYPQIEYMEQLIGRTRFIVTNPYENSEEAKESNILQDVNDTVNADLTVVYIKKKQDNPPLEPVDDDRTPTPPNLPTIPPNVVSPSNPPPTWFPDLPWGSIIPPTPPTPVQTTQPVATGHAGTLYSIYECSLEDVNALAGFLWSQEYLTNVLQVNTNPIENVLSLKLTCITLPPSGKARTISLGNVDTGVTAAVVENNYHGQIGVFVAPSMYNSFLDCTPFTTYELYLPFVGYVELDSNLILNEPIRVEINIDALTLISKYQLIRDKDELIVGEWEFNIAIDLPISASNMFEATLQRGASLMNSVLAVPSAIGAVATGNFSGAINSGASFVNGLMSAVVTQAHTTTSGTPTANTSLLTNRTVFLRITRPQWQELSLFNHTRGRTCNLTYQLGQLSGFTKCFAGNDLSGIPCTDMERDIIENLLTGGIYL